MSQLHLPWLEISLLLPLIGAVLTLRYRNNPDQVQHSAVLFTGLTAATTLGASLDFASLHAWQAHDALDVFSMLFGGNLLVLDELSAPLLPLTAGLFFLTALTTVRTKMRRFSFRRMLLAEVLALATLSTANAWAIIILTALATIPPYLELRARQRPTRVYVLHMGVFVAALLIGWTGVQWEGTAALSHSLWAILPLLLALLIRSGSVPVHCWLTDLFEHATFGTALLFVTPMADAYIGIRLVLPVAPDWMLRSIGVISLITAVYASGMALVQQEARRFFSYLFLSHSALVLVGLDAVNEIGLTGALSVWFSIGLALGGFGLTLRAVEGRRGRISLAEFQGLYDNMPALAVCFLLTGLASVGFPGTFGFVGMELLIDGVVAAYPFVGVAIILASALNGIAILRAFWMLFTGTRHVSSISLQIGWRERFAVLSLAALIIGGGLYPQPGVASRHHAAVKLLQDHHSRFPADPSPAEHPHGHAE